MAKRKKAVLKKLKLKQARKKDLVEVEKYYQKNGKKKAKYKPIYGIPFWLINSKGELEEKPYILSENTDMDDMGIWLSREQVYILNSWRK